jgi:hypothetical protein
VAADAPLAHLGRIWPIRLQSHSTAPVPPPPAPSSLALVLVCVCAGDFETAQDLEFIIANKITRIINCAGREIANAWERSGIRYLTFFWPEAGNCVIFDDSNSVLDDLYAFIEEALDIGESVLVHSTDGQSRACFCAGVYFMLKYKWCERAAGRCSSSWRQQLRQ